MVPRSNWFQPLVSSNIRKCYSTYVDTAWQITVGELQLKVELICALRQLPVSAQGNLIFKQRRESISKILSTLLAPARTRPQILFVGSIAAIGRSWVPIDLYKTMQANDQMRYADSLADAQPYMTFDSVARRVLFVRIRIFGLDVEICNVPRLGAEGRCDAGEDAASRRRRQCGLRPVGGGRHALDADVTCGLLSLACGSCRSAYVPSDRMLLNRFGDMCQDVMSVASRGGARRSQLLPLIISQMRPPRWPMSQSCANMRW